MILDRYLFRLWFPSFLGFFLVVNIILLFGRGVRAIQAFGDNPINGDILLEMMLAISPYFLLITLPFAFFFAMLKAFTYLQQNSESDALLAAGVSPFRLLRPMFALAVMIWIFLSWTAMEWMPAGQKTFLVLYHAVKSTSVTPTFIPGQFTESLEDLTIYHTGENEQGYMQQFMLEDKRTTPASIYIAKEANIQRHKQFITLNMYDGVHLEGEGPSLRTTYFTTFSFSIDVGDLGIVRIPLHSGDKAIMMSSTELSKAMAQSPNLMMQAEWHRRWLLPSTVFVLFLFALPLSVNGKRSGKSKGWIWGVGLLLIVYNTQIGLFKQVALGRFDWWVMWAGQLSFIMVGLALLMIVIKYDHFNFRNIVFSLFKKHK